MLADGATNPDPWVQDNDSHHLNIRQLYVEMGNFAEFTGPLKRAQFGPASASIGITSISTYR